MEDGNVEWWLTEVNDDDDDWNNDYDSGISQDEGDTDDDWQNNNSLDWDWSPEDLVNGQWDAEANKDAEDWTLPDFPDIDVWYHNL